MPAEQRPIQLVSGTSAWNLAMPAGAAAGTRSAAAFFSGSTATAGSIAAGLEKAGAAGRAAHAWALHHLTPAAVARAQIDRIEGLLRGS